MNLSLLAVAYSLILIVASRLLHPCSTDDKTSRLMVKRFFNSEGHPESFTELHREEKRKREIEVTKRRRGTIKRGENNLASNQCTMCSSQSGTTREVHGVTQRRGRREIEVTRRRGAV